MAELREELNLGGAWTLVADPDNRGVGDAWFSATPAGGALSVRVPAVWDLWIPDYDGVGWYFHAFDVPETWRDSRVELCFDGVNYYAEAWMNDVSVGAHEGGYTPFAFDISAVVQPGENRLAVRVIDPKGKNGFGHFLPEELPIAKEMGYWSFGGIWGDVYLRRMPHTRITDIFIQPDLRRKRIVVETAAANLPDDAHIRLSVEDTPFNAQGAPGSITIDVTDFEPWHPDTPRLYRLRAEVCAGDNVLDRVITRFGMREFSVKDNRFHLNNRPIYLKGVLYQPDYPRTLVAPENKDMARREIALAKEAGFNMMRLHIKPAPKIILELADEMGMLLYEEPSIGWIKDSEYMRQRCEASVREMILRDRNHPSVVIWDMLNETGNAKYATHGGAQNIKDALCRLARSLDPTRVIIDDSAGVNATREPSRLMRPFRNDFVEFDDLHIYQRAPVDNLIRAYYRNSGEPDQLTTISEFGFGGPEDLEDVLAQYGDRPDSDCPPDGQEKRRLKDARFLQAMLDACRCGFHERGLDKVFGDMSGFFKAAQTLQCDAALAQIAAIRANPKVGGYCHTQLSDAGHEFCAGFLDRWRRPKPALKSLTEAQRPMRPLIFLRKSNLRPRENTEVTVLLANETNLADKADISLQVVGPTNQVLWKKKRAAKLPRHGGELWSGVIGASGSTGAHRFVVRLMQGMTVIAEATETFFVYDSSPPAETPAHILDPHDQWQERIAAYAKPDNILAPMHIIPPLANTIRAYPDNELMQILAQVKGGAIAVFFAPPDDWNDLAELLDHDITATPKDAVGGFLPACHYVKLHPLFDKLPSRCLMRQPYANVAPGRTFLETGDEDICGTFDTTPIAADNYMVESSESSGDSIRSYASPRPPDSSSTYCPQNSAWWGSDILIQRYGSGRIVFTHLRILEHLGEDPVADRLFVNLLNHFGRRSVPPTTPLPPDQKAVEWLRAQRSQHVRRWMVLGEFPNWRNCGGFDTAYPPEKTIDFDAVYQGWYQPARWRRWYSCTRNNHLVDLQAAFEPVFQWYPKFDRAVAYAYAEINSEKRIETEMRVGFMNATRIWVNGAVVFETRRQVPHDQFETDTAPVTLRQGKNSILVKCAKIPGPFKFSVDFEDTTAVTQYVKWWK